MSTRRICAGCGDAVPWPSGFPRYDAERCRQCDNIDLDEAHAALDLLFVAVGLALVAVLTLGALAWWGLR